MHSIFENPVWMTLIFLVVPGTIGFIIDMTDTRWWQRRRAATKPYGKQRLPILLNKWRLEDLVQKAKKAGVPTEPLWAAITQCDADLKRLDQLVEIPEEVGALCKTAVAEVDAQSEVVDYLVSVSRTDAVTQPFPVRLQERRNEKLPSSVG